MQQDSLGSTSGTADASGNSASTLRYFPYGTTRFSTGTIPTDEKFTGQRLDQTGLYYYGARYYDPTIGRFISPDPTVPDTSNPQALNRYSYCNNNPLKYTDPTGLDWIVVGGQSSEYSERQQWWDRLVSNNLLDPAHEYLYFLPDTEPGFILGDSVDINPRYQDLINHLSSQNVKFTNLKIVGHSEGAATVGQLMADFVNGTGNLPQSVKDILSAQLRAVFLLECPTGWGTSSVVKNFDYNNLNNVGERLSKKGIKSADIYNGWSVVHREKLSGWNEVDTRKWYDTFAGIWGTGTYHSRIKTDALDVMKTILK